MRKRIGGGRSSQSWLTECKYELPTDLGALPRRVHRILSFLYCPTAAGKYEQYERVVVLVGDENENEDV
jgi:hypothetical protein